MILRLVLRSLRQHLVSTTLTCISLALGAGLAMSLFVVQDQAERAFTGDRLGFDAVLGARGSSLQLVLNAIFHLETSPGNIPWTLYDTVKANPGVELAVPYALGDNYQGFRIVGTTGQLFTDLEFKDGGRFALREGEWFDDRYREAIVGSYAADRLGLKLGEVIHPYHGLSYDPAAQHPEEYVISGILEPTNTPADRVIWIPIEGIFRMEGHVLRGTGEDYLPEKGVPIPAEHKEVSCVLLKFSSPQTGFALATMINRQGKVATLAFPIGGVMSELFQKLGWGTMALRLVAYMVALVALLSMTAALYNTLNERRRDIAIIRLLGGSRRFVFLTIVLESAVIGLIGSLASYLVHLIVVASVGELLWHRAGVLVSVWSWHPALVLIPCGMIVLSALAGLLPAFQAYRTDVAGSLQPLS